MMKVSDPIMFGHCVRAYYGDVFEKHEALFNEIGVDANNGIGDVYAKIEGLSAESRVRADLEAVYETRPEQAMVDSDKGITNLHVPSNVIIDASMPAAIRSSGQMWGPDGRLHDAKMVIPDRCYASIYQEVIQNCKDHGAFDVGKVTVTDQNGEVVMEHVVNKGDIWRMCQAKDLPIRDWVKLAVMRARATGSAAIFWLDENRAHDRNLIELVNKYLAGHDMEGLDIRIESPVAAMRSTLKRVRAGKDTISVTGNVLRDYLTDLFPILELGTSAKMLSIVPLLAGGGLYETGAGGSAPKHVQQFVSEGHLRWDSLGEFLALAVSIEDVADRTGSDQARLIAQALNDANGRYLEENRAPSRKVNELDNRGSHYFLARYWAEAVAANENDAELAARFKAPSQALIGDAEKILAELLAAQGKPVDIGGYYRPDDELTTAAMRPSPTLNAIIDSI
jgi:isocitrate dehydrogenase